MSFTLCTCFSHGARPATELEKHLRSSQSLRRTRTDADARMKLERGIARQFAGRERVIDRFRENPRRSPKKGEALAAFMLREGHSVGIGPLLMLVTNIFATLVDSKS